MTTISRRGFTLGVGAAALAMPRVESTSGRAADVELTGYILATRFDPETGVREPGLTVLDLADDADATIDVPVVEDLFPVAGTAYAVAITERAAYVAAAAAAASAMRPAGGATFDDDLLDLVPFYSPVSTSSTRFAVFNDGARPRWLIDLQESTVTDLIATFAREDSFFQLAAFTPDGARLLLATSDLIHLVDPAALRVDKHLSDADGLAMPQLAPDGLTVGYVHRGDGQAPALLVTVALDWPERLDRPAVTHEFRDESRTLGFTWIDDGSVLLTTLAEGGSTRLARLDLAATEPSAIGTIQGGAGFPRVLANGTRALIATDIDQTTSWRLIDLDRGDIVRIPELDEAVPVHPLGRSTRAVLFEPYGADRMATAAESYRVLNTATGAITASVARVEGQLYPPPVISPDGRAAAIGATGPAGEELRLLDLVRGELVTLPDHLGAIFSPDSRFVLTREAGKDAPLTIRSLDGAVVRELGRYDRAWWLG